MFFAAILILVIFSIIIFTLSRIISRPGIGWLMAVIGGAIAWVLILLSYSDTPQTIQILDWTRSDLLNVSPTLLSDQFSWPFAVSISTLMVATLLTDIARVEEIQPIFWSMSLALTSLGLLSVYSGNPLTLALTWSILDLFEILTRFLQVRDDQERRYVIISLSTRILGSMLLVLTMIRINDLTFSGGISTNSSQVAGIFILAAGLRLGVLPFQAPFLKEIPTRRGFGTLRRLVPVAASIVLLMRVSDLDLSLEWSGILTTVGILALLYGSLTWLWVKDELEGRPFWILGFSALSIIAAVHSDPLSTQAWGVSLIFSGGILFLYSWRDRRFIWILILGMLGFSALPFTPAWFGLSILDGRPTLLWIIFILSMVLLIFGYFRHMRRPEDMQGTLEPWTGILYPVGLATLPVAHFWIMWVVGGIAIPPNLFGNIYWWVGVVILILLIPIFFLDRSRFSLHPGNNKIIRGLISFDLLNKFLERIYRTMGNIFNYFLQMLERDGGILWAALILILILAIFINSFAGS